MSGSNYAWFQFRMQLAAADVHESAGTATIPKLFEAFRFDDAALIARLTDAVHPAIGAFAATF
jgi:hypothetical protein